VDDSFRYDFSLDEIGAALWSPERPNLYALQYRLFSDGRVIDIVDSYFGLRKIEVTGEGIRINDVTTFLRMVLVQGYYPEGGYAPRSYRRMEEDIRTIQSMGFNGARIHQKIESPYFHYLCDRLGLLTTFEMPSFYAPSKKAFRAYESELREIIERDSLHPSSIMWILFNETWGIWGIYRAHSRTRRFVMDMVALLKDKDPSRPVIDNSGWEHIRTDIADFHHYLRSSELSRRVYARFRSGDPDILYKFSLSAVLAFYLFNRVGTATRSLFLERSADRDEVPRFLSEYGGFGWYEHTKGVSIVDDIETYTRDVIESDAFCGYCLTQLYDVEKETNGLLSFDRKPKIDIERMRKINSV
jgi:hypothetical protein